MSDPAQPKSAKAAKPETHPPVKEMVNNAIKTMNQRGGSSLQAIKKFMKTEYEIDVEKLSPFVKKYLKSAVQKRELIQTRGKGASGSFKLPVVKKSAAAKRHQTM